MLKAGPARKVIIHLNEDTVAPNGFLYKEIFAFLFSHGVAGATLIRPEAGFGSHHRIHAAHNAAPGEEGHLPVRIEFIESVEKVQQVLPELCQLVTDGLIECQETFIHHSATTKEIS